MNLRSATTVLTVLAFGAAALTADKAAPKKPTGTWERKTDQFTVGITIEPEELKLEFVGADGKTITVHAAYGVTDEGVLFGVLTKVEKQGDDGPAKGDLFSFRCKVEKDVLTLSEMTATHDNPQARDILQGEYKAKKK
jgi:hypothetical protein